MTTDPEEYGQQTAEALVQGLEAMKRQLLDRRGDDLGSQLAAGHAAVEAMKQLLDGLTDGMDAR